MKKSPFVITISGDPLAGKSSAISALTQKYEQEGFFIGESEEGRCIVRLAAGQMFRSIADNTGIALQELNDFAKQPGNSMRKLRDIAPEAGIFASMSDEILDKSVDAFIDEYMLNNIEMLKAKYFGKENVLIIVDSRIAGLLMKKLGRENMGIRFSIQPEIAARRLVKDAQNRTGEISVANVTGEEAYNIAFESVKSRTAKERERFIKTYSSDIFNQDENDKVDIQHLDNYDLVIDTSGTTIDREIDVLYSCIERAREGIEYDKFWRSTKYILPGSVTKKEIDTDKDPRISAIKVDGQYYAVYGQEFIGVANHMGYTIEQKTGEESGYPLIPVDLIAKRKQFIFEANSDGTTQGIPADLYVQRNITKDLIEKFERDYGFKYPKIGIVEDKKPNRRNSGPKME